MPGRELYAADHTFNHISEHGGGAIQRSVWGYDPVGAARTLLALLIGPLLRSRS